MSKKKEKITRHLDFDIHIDLENLKKEIKREMLMARFERVYPYEILEKLSLIQKNVKLLANQNKRDK